MVKSRLKLYRVFFFADSTHIVDCKLKLILGLIWTLILHYSITMPMWDGEEENVNNGQGPTPKQRLVIVKKNLKIQQSADIFVIFAITSDGSCNV